MAQTLDSCDRILGELGRRRHLFAWLRAPGAGVEDWLEVAAYYPSNRLVVVWHQQPGENDHLYTELVPAHGLKLLELAQGELRGDLEELELVLRKRIASLGPVPRHATEPQMEEHESPMVRAMASLALPAEPRASRPGRHGRAQPSAPRPRAAGQASTGSQRRRRDPSPGAGTRAAQLLGMELGLVLAAVLLVEVYLGVMRLGLDAGRVILAFGLAFDACSRALGTIAAARSGLPEWAWGCALGGSPFVAAFALSSDGSSARAEPAPLAGLISLLAIAVLVLAAFVALAAS